MASNNINVSKKGILSVKDTLVENNIKFGYNLLPENCFNGGYYAGSISTIDSTGKYTVTSPVNSTTWGTGFSIKNNIIIVPYGCIYRFKMDVFVPTAHKIQVDINNAVPGGTVWSGNDNDVTASRYYSNLSIPANTWTTVIFGGINAHEKNTKKEDISVYDGIGLVTSADTASVTWYVRNPAVYVGFNERDILGISKDNLYSNLIYEI